MIDVDDSADEVTVPSDVSSFDVGKLLEDLMESFTEGMSGSASAGFSYSG